MTPYSPDFSEIVGAMPMDAIYDYDSYSPWEDIEWQIAVMLSGVP